MITGVILFVLYMLCGIVAMHVLETQGSTILGEFMHQLNKRISKGQRSVHLDNNEESSALHYFLVWLLWPLVILMIIYFKSILEWLEEGEDESESKKNFVEDYLNGDAPFFAIRVHIYVHKQSGYPISIWEYLGLSKDEYDLFLSNPKLLEAKLKERKNKIENQKELCG